MGSALEKPSGKAVWPPSLKDLLTGYDDMEDLLDPDLRPTEIIDSVMRVYPVYDSLLDDINRCNYQVGNPERRFIPYPYDFRRSNADSAEGLAEVLDGFADLDELILIGHSMGGLVLRFLLESGDYDDRDWFPNVTMLITLGTPHFGSPKAVRYLTGEESMLGVQGSDLVRLASDPRYPSVYELVGPETTAFTIPRPLPGTVPAPTSPFDADMVASLQLTEENIQSAKRFWGELGLDRRPAHVDYFFFGGSAHRTIARMERELPGSAPNLEPVERRESGDGTVPITSAIVANVAHGYSAKKHSRIFEDRDLRRALYRFLDAPIGVVPHAAAADEDVGQPDAFGVSVDKDAYLVGEPIEIVASYNRSMADPTESFQFLPIDATTGDTEPVASASLQVQFSGVGVTGFSMAVLPDLEPGLYQLRPLREVDDPEPTVFTVVESHG
jgi:pimeloyl-ACP methyl ester carboxylesterase